MRKDGLVLAKKTNSAGNLKNRTMLNHIVRCNKISGLEIANNRGNSYDRLMVRLDRRFDNHIVFGSE
jgi:hypothetical protein